MFISWLKVLSGNNKVILNVNMVNFNCLVKLVAFGKDKFFKRFQISIKYFSKVVNFNQ